MTQPRKHKSAGAIELAAGNGILDRRALLSKSAALAGAMSAGAVGAATEPLANDPWTLAPGIPVPAYGVPSRFEDKTVRTLTNPKGDPRGSGARTPHHLLNGTITPNGLHFVVARGGIPDIKGAPSSFREVGLNVPTHFWCGAYVRKWPIATDDALTAIRRFRGIADMVGSASLAP
jgi:sulfane dehydrogenase subunit SoxC